MNYNEVLQNAKEKMAPNCRVCKECNGIVCKGEIPGTGGKGNGNAFKICVDFLSSVKIKLDTIYQNEGQDTSISLFGKDFKYPFFVAPIGGMNLNYNGAITESEYIDAVVNGSLKAGTAAFTGDGANDSFFLDSLPYIKAANGVAVPTIKPWKNDKALEKIKMLEEAGAMAFAMDIDSAGLVNLALAGKPVSAKSVEELSELASSTKVPFIVKGVMTKEGALKALEAGAYGIVVSSHGGRVLQDAPATCAMLSEIREAVGDKLKIFVDGGIRSGADVFKAIALGADAVLIGRTYVIAAFGGGAEGVELYTEKIGAELRDVMIMSGCKSLSDITRDKIIL
ncbi:alpha-hydroxy-acid oxidizing protein [Sedimentibacter hydroxybenzoicus DSM 7310]|uniref:L-lactate oxidase n=1 Tax=Sedimentibacter hydroxybenzoicus DSM 7310 TaxID=1123245 RepID=A0A974BLG9_SEDHY|nr:alpha-hydroxy-acid oxidizing protein [Sedimentibacter hydroxybenzoicus]NYB75016.1 alpha-hydroxy-acid oxidizing protein [Sedimentibacter hydroxybenzoicus DSM 7310]